MIHTFSIDNLSDTKFLLRYSKHFLQVFHRFLGITVIVVQNVRPVTVNNCTEGQAIPPTGVEVGYFNFIIAVVLEREQRY